MGTENDILGNGMLYYAVEGTDDFKPIGIVSHVDLSKVSTENDISDEWLDRRIIPDDMVINGTFVIKGKCKCKTFKKWLMSIGFQRNDADLICNIIGACK